MSRLVRINIGFAAAMMLLIGISVSTYRNMLALSRSDEISDRMVKTLLQLSNLQSVLKDAETGQRGFLLTGNENYLAPYATAQDRVKPTLALVEEALLEHSEAVPGARAEMARLRSLVDEKMMELAKTVELRRVRGLSAALDVVRSDRGQNLMDEIRTLTHTIRSQLEHEVESQAAYENAQAASAAKIVLSGSVLTLILILFATVILNIELKQRRRIERELIAANSVAHEAARAKSEFLANMSHEIRTPLNGIIGMSEILLESRLEDEQRKLARIVKESGYGLLTIINDILDFSKVDAGQLDLEMIDFTVDSVIDGQVELLSAKAHEKGVALATQIDPSVPAQLRGDPGRIAQVLLNLVGNAIKFTEKGSITVSVESREPLPDGRPVIHCVVRDTGIGLTQAEIARLFRPFTQADGSTARRFGGTGLGLAISLRLVKLMGGEIGVKSEPGVGSDFWFTLPLEPALQPPEARLESQLVPTPPRAPRQLRILVAEDNSVNQMLILAQLKGLGYLAHAVGNGREVLDALSAAEYDLVLMDCQMPEMDGFEATRVIRANESVRGERHLMIVALTANALKEDEARCRESGMDDYLSKPVKKEVLASTLARWLAGADAVGVGTARGAITA